MIRIKILQLLSVNRISAIDVGHSELSDKLL